MSIFDVEGAGSYEPLDKFATHSAIGGSSLDLGSTIWGGAVATITDVGTTIWNSLLPERYEASTVEVLSKISDDALQIYNENPDTIKTLSFVGGLALPVGLSIKGMNMLRSGAKGFSWFSKEGQAAQLTRAEQAYMQEGAGSYFSKEAWKLYGGVAANAVADNVAAEALIVATMNSHPYMEDYTKDLGSNFVKSVAFGTGIQTALGGVATRAALKAKTGEVDKTITTTLKDSLIDPAIESGVGMARHSGEQVAIKLQGVENLKSEIALATSGENPRKLSPFAIRTLQNQLINEEGKLVDALKLASEGELAKHLEGASRDEIEHFLGLLADERHAGVDKINFAQVSGETTKQEKPSVLSSFPILKRLVKDKVTGEESLKAVDAVYIPYAGQYVGASDYKMYGTVADVAQSFEQVEKRAARKNFFASNPDWSMEISAKHTSLADADYAEALVAFQKMDAKTLQKVEIDQYDLPALKAARARATSLIQEDPSAAIQLKITKGKPSWQAVQQEALSARGGVAEDYVKKLQGVTKEWDSFSNFHPDRGTKFSEGQQGLSRAAFIALDDWVAGEYSFLRTGALSRSQAFAAIKADLPASRLAKAKEAASVLDEIYHSSASTALRSRLQQLADADGYIWAYRGLRQKADTHHAIESYTLTADKAAEFGSVSMFKIKVDDIVTGLHDIGSGDRKTEILVRLPTRENVAVDPSKPFDVPEELVVKGPRISATGQAIKISSLDDLDRQISEAQTVLMKELQEKGYGIETIALKTGTSIEAIEDILVNGNKAAALLKYTTETDVIAATAQRNRGLAVSVNQDRILQPSVFAELNKRNLDTSSDSLLRYSFEKTEAWPILQNLFTPEVDALKTHFLKAITSVTPSALKSTLFSSADQALSAMGEVGQYATYFGKQAVKMKMDLAERYEKPLATTAATLVQKGKSELGLIEANTSLTVNASIKGPRIYHDGKFYVPTEAGAKKFDLQGLLAAKREGPEVIGPLLEQLEAELLIEPARFKGQSYVIRDPKVKELWEQMHSYGREIYELKNAKNLALGRAPLNDLGTWTPAANPIGKSIAYVHNLVDDTTSMIYAETDELLKTAVANYEKNLSVKYGDNWRQREQVFTKDMQAQFNKMAGRHDPMTMTMVDASMLHGGSSATAIVPTDSRMLQEILLGYQATAARSVEDAIDIRFSDIMSHLKQVSEVSQQGYVKETKGFFGKAMNKPLDPGQTVRNVLLGRSNLSQHTPWAEWQERTQVGIDLMLDGMRRAFAPVLDPITTKISGGKIRTAEDYEKLWNEAQKNGVVFPFEALEKELGLGRYLEEGKGAGGSRLTKAVGVGNAAATVSLLRFGELAQPLVNALSLPILTSAAVNRKMSASFMGVELDKTVKFSVMREMMDGLRLLMHPTEGARLETIMREKGISDVELRNITELVAYQKSLDPSLSETANKVLESKFVKMMSKPADWSESVVRQVAFATGFSMAKRAYKGIGEDGATIFARSLMDEAIGNYTSVQRPAMFQGTIGSAMGLFQTYMLTMAQSIYRQAEHRDWASLGKMLLTQGSIFGASSLPGFHVVSEAIGTHFSQQHYDLESGTMRAIQDDAANILLYGLPSSFGPGVVTRGDIRPRVPTPFTLDSVVAVNVAKQGYDAMEKVAKAAWHADENAGKAILEAISLQSVSRPLARMSELVSGNSITSRGDLVASGLRPTDADQFFSLSTLSRVMSTRPLEEIKARQALQLNYAYNAADSEKRRAVTTRLKSHIRNGDLDSATLEALAEQYMRTGTSTGWRSAVTEAIKQANMGGTSTTMEKLKKNEPLMLLIDDLD